MTNWLRPLLARILARLSMVLTLAGLAGLAYLGHRYDWKMPSFSSSRPEGGKTDDDNPSEDPGIPVEKDSAGKEKSEPPELKTIHLSDPGTVRRAGLEQRQVQLRTMTQQVRAFGVLDYDQTRYVLLPTRVQGIAWRVLKELGDQVAEGDVLALVECPDVGKAKAEFLQSLARASKAQTDLEQLKISEAVPDRTRRDAEILLREARIKLLADQRTLVNFGLPVKVEEFASLNDDQRDLKMRELGLPASLIPRSELEKLTSNLLPIKAPFAGEIVNRNIVKGQLATPGTPLFTLADVSHVWVMLDVRREEANRVRKDQEVVFLPDDAQEEKPENPAPSDSKLAVANGGRLAVAVGAPPVDSGPTTGRVDWISPEVDEKTCTVRVRAVVPNPHRRLRPHTFGTGLITLYSHPNAMVVPSTAIQNEGSHQLVFVVKDSQTFEPREVQTGIKDDKYTEIVSGLSPKDWVVTTGSLVLKTELFKERLGGGDE